MLKSVCVLQSRVSTLQQALHERVRVDSPPVCPTRRCPRPPVSDVSRGTRDQVFPAEARASRALWHQGACETRVRHVRTRVQCKYYRCCQLQIDKKIKRYNKLNEYIVHHGVRIYYIF